jgi:hypothetical protein
MDLTDCDEKFVQGTITDIAGAYDTVPTPVVKPPFQQPNEEALHTSFEEAISDRLIALHTGLDRISQRLPSAPPHDIRPVLLQNAQASGAQQGQTTKLSLHVTVQQRITIFACFALMFLLSGFDLMGVLVLHMH